VSAPSSLNRPPILLLTVQIYGKAGGVPAYSRRIAEILSGYAEQEGRPLSCVSFGDTAADPARHSRPVRYASFAGVRGNRGQFLRQAFSIARGRRGGLAVVAHLGQSPVAWILRSLGLIRNYIVVLHGVEAWNRVDWLDRIALRRAAAIVATTHFTAKRFAELNQIPLSLVRVIPLALDLDEASVPPLPPQADTLRILSVGRIAAAERYKGFETLIEAVKILRDRHVPAMLTIVGTGDDVPTLREIRDRLDLGDSVQLPGEVSSAELENQFRDCDVFALPSKGEGFGIVFLEAMRWAKPCIGGNHGGTPEVIVDGATGFLVEHGDAKVVADRLMDLYRDPELRKSTGQSGFERVRAEYLYPRMRDRWLALLADMDLGAKGTSSNGMNG